VSSLAIARQPQLIMRSPASLKVNGTWAFSDNIEAYGTWEVSVRAAPGFGPGADTGPIILLAVGVLSVALLMALLGSLLTSRSRAVRAVERATRSLRSTEERFAKLVCNSSDLICVLNAKAELVYASPAGERVLGFVPSQYVGRNMLDLVHPTERDSVAKAFAEHSLRPGVHAPSVFRFQTASGEWRTLEVVATNCLDDPAVAGIVMNARDVTDRTNLTRAMRTLAKSNQVLVNASDETSLLVGACNTFIEAGNYPLAWVGFVGHEDDPTVRPVAWAGLSGYLERVTVTCADDEHGQGPVGIGVRTGTVQVMQDVITSKAFDPWRAAAAEFGFRSSCALPLHVGGKVIGALSIYATEPGAFGPPQVALLSELADALAYGIGRLRDASSLQASEERFRSLAVAAPIGILEVSPLGDLTYANPRTAQITGRDIHTLMGQGWTDVVHPDDSSQLMVPAERAGPLAKEATTFRIRRPGGEVRHVRTLVAPKAFDLAGGYVVTVEDITEEVQAQEALHYQAFYDTLTGLPNRALFLDRLEQELARHRHAGPNMAVLFVDLDRFKIVNDSLGHPTGDAVLKEVGSRFKGGVRAGDTAARFSGDEFVFIVLDVKEIEDAVIAAKRLQSLLEPPVRCGDMELTVTASIGIVIPDAGADAPTVLRDADAAMYQAKEEGRNRYALFDEALRRRSVTVLAMEGELRQALARQEFEVYYQPVVEPANGRLVGAEALVRWHHPTRGLVLPLEFIPVAEDTGLIKPLGRWVFEQAVSQLASWDAEEDGPRLQVLTVNLSARQLDGSEAPEIVRRVLELNGVLPSRVCVEVTESVMMADSASTRESVEAFKGLGLQVAIDDFGTGYSSLAYLHTLPVTTVKVDRSFVERLGGREDSTPVVKAVIEMSHAMGLNVVAEGVGNEQLAVLVSDMGCDAAQGFYWARPMPAAAFASWARQTARPVLALPRAG
jgi:diguanylate cyclase (GGDEF)-like protein/PAS domain S-box-containing protein